MTNNIIKMETIDSIYFYSEFELFGAFSNFSTAYFTDKDGLRYNCSEQYLMLQKCLLFDQNNTELLRKITNSKSPAAIKLYGRQVKNFDENIWSQHKYKIMLQGLRYKFNQNPISEEMLLYTGNKIIYEASKRDAIWGIGYNIYEALRTNKENYGKNLLGKALMELRDEIKMQKDVSEIRLSDSDFE